MPYSSGFHPQGSRWDPLNATTSGTYTPSPADLFMNSGDFGQNAQYGTLLQQDYTNPGGSTGVFYEDFRNVINNPC